MKNSGKKYSFYSNNNLSLRSVSESKYESQINYIEIIKEKDKEIKKLQKELFYLKKYSSNIKPKKSFSKNLRLTNQKKKSSFEINNISYYEKLIGISNTPKKNNLNNQILNYSTPKKKNYSKYVKNEISFSKINLNKRKNESIEISQSINNNTNSNILINDYKIVFQNLLKRTKDLFNKINGN